MSGQRVLGFVLLAVGLVLLLMGWNASQSLGEEVRETFTGRFSGNTTWYFIGGAASAVAGLVLAATGRTRRV